MDPRQFADMHLHGAPRGTSDVPLDELEHEESARTAPPTSEVAGAPHPSIIADSHFGALSTAQTFENYYKQGIPYDAKLPITAYRDEIMATIESNSVVVIQGATGSGKTTQVPQYILDRSYERQQHCNIIVTQPRRIAAITVARRICSERHWNLGGLVGYQIAMNRMVTEDTRLTFCTTGTLLEKLIQSKNMTQYTHVILDEVHERDDEIDLAMLVVRKMLRTNSKHVKVILMSATIATEEFSKYFASEIQGVLQNAPVLTVEGQMYPVQVHYLDDYEWLIEKNFFSSQMDDGPGLTDYTRRMCCELIRLFDTMEADQEQTSYGRGTVLVFLPGMGEISDVADNLEPLIEKERLQIVKLHSSIHVDDQQKAFDPPERGRRKVILATNIAESSITVPDVCYVIDFCLVKQLSLDAATNYSALRTIWASRASMMQRQGRAGRVQSGHCYRLIYKQFMHESIQEYSIPEMQRQSLEQVVLRVKSLDMGDPQSLLDQALSPPKRDRIAQTVLALKQVGALSLFSAGLPNIYDGELTFAGKIMAQLPVDVRVARMMLLGHVFGYLNECLVMGAVLSLRSLFTYGYKDTKLQAFHNKLRWSDNSQSDSLASLHAYMEWKLRKEDNRFRGRNGERQWGNSVNVHIQRMHEIDRLIVELRGRLEKFNIVADRSLAQKARNGLTEIDKFMLKTILAGAFYPFYFALRRDEDDDAAKSLSGHDQLTTVQIMGMPPSAPVYEREIKKLFEPCGKVKKVHFEASTKAFVEFERPSGREGQQRPKNMDTGVLVAVQLALKMRHLRYDLTFELDPQRDSRYADEQSRQVFSDFYGTAPVEAQPEQRSLPQVDLSLVQHFEVTVTEVLDANRFWVQKTDSGGDLAAVAEWIERRKQSFKTLRHVEPGMVCVALWSEDMNFYRARVETINRGDNTAQVTFLDYGNCSNTPLADLKECPEHLFKIKQQALECVLAGIRPVSLHSSGGSQWSQNAIQLASDMMMNKRLWAQIYSIVDHVVHCELVDTSHQNSDVNLSSALIDHNVAESCDESLASKRAHDARLDVLAGRTPPPAPEAAAASFQPAALEEGWTQVANPVGDGTYRRECEEIRVKGPYSSYELAYNSVTKPRYTARFERDSVNSASVDDMQASGFQRIAVAANVGLAPSGFHMVVRESTMMPNIKGLPALITMLFCPTLEMRADKTGQHYTGCLCGSGPNPATKEPAFPEDDIEVVFDVAIDQADLADINSIRRGINIALMDNGAFEKVKWVGGTINRLQSVQQEKMVKLVQRERSGVAKMETCGTEYQWNKVHADRVFPAEEIDPDLKESGPVPFLNVHAGIRLYQTPEEQAKGVQEGNILERVQKLYAVASRSDVPLDPPVECPMCKFIASTPRALLQHVNSRDHRVEELKIFA